MTVHFRWPGGARQTGNYCFCNCGCLWLCYVDSACTPKADTFQVCTTDGATWKSYTGSTPPTVYATATYSATAGWTVNYITPTCSRSHSFGAGNNALPLTYQDPYTGVEVTLSEKKADCRGACPDCCGSNSPLAFDVDLTGFAYTFYCSTCASPTYCATSCANGCGSLVAVVTVEGGPGSPCAWHYTLAVCSKKICTFCLDGSTATICQIDSISVQLFLFTDGAGNCYFQLVLKRTDPPAGLCTSYYGYTCDYYGVGTGPGWVGAPGAAITYQSATFAAGGCTGSFTLTRTDSNTINPCAPDLGCCLSTIPSTVVIESL